MKKYLLPVLLMWMTVPCFAQDEEASPQTEKVYETFRSTRLVNLHTTELLEQGVGEFRVSHRFGSAQGGVNNLFGLDNATVRIAFEYGVCNSFMIGAGRSTIGKVYDGFAKWRFLQQGSGMPVSAALFGSMTITTLKEADYPEYNSFSKRTTYTGQLILARKFGERLAFQFSPTMTYKELTFQPDENNLNVALPVAGKFNISKVFSINAEYIYRIDGAALFHNSLSVGLSIDTRGHFFGLHLTNSSQMVENGYMFETFDSWEDGNIHFGFNIIRHFNINKRP